MRKILLAAALVLAPPTWAKPQVALPHPQPVCRSVPDFVQIISYMRNDAALTQVMQQKVSAGECILLPTGAPVTLIKQNDMFVCLRTGSLRPCGWTVLSPDLVKALGGKI